MQLVIDRGNTKIKTALFEKNKLLHFFLFDSIDDFIASNLIHNYSISNCIICTVVNNIDVLIEELKKHISVLVFTNSTPSPIINKYNSPKTLGIDRIAASVGANFINKNNNTLVIDAGTCIKYNFINNNNEFIGGAISPGLEMRFKAINTFTDSLPLLKIEPDFDTFIGRNSNENILSGVELGTVAEINSFIDQYKTLYADIKIMLTGGDTIFFEKRLKKPIFADPFLTLKGLNSILNHNLK